MTSIAAQENVISLTDYRQRKMVRRVSATARNFIWVYPQMGLATLLAFNPGTQTGQREHQAKGGESFVL
jgi:hypothetical protein